MNVPDGFVSVEAKNVEVTKTINDHQFESLAVVMTIHSNREEAALVEVSESIPAGGEPEDVWFHPDYGEEHWEVGADSVTFSRPFEAGEQFTAVYGLDEFDREEAELLAEPSVQVDIDAPIVMGETEKHGEASSEGPLDSLFEETAEESKAQSGADDADSTGEPEAESSQDRDSITADTDADATEDSSSNQVEMPISGGIGRVLAKELRQDRVTAKDRQHIREALAPGGGSVDARIEHLSREFKELGGYSEALEAFLDEESGAKAVIESFEDRADELRSKIDSVRESVEEIDTRIEGVQETVDENDDQVDELGTALDDQVGRIDEVDKHLQRIRDDLESIDDELDRVEDIDRRIDGFEDHIDQIRDEITELTTFRDRLTTVVGANEGAPAHGGSDDDEGVDDSTVIEEE